MLHQVALEIRFALPAWGEQSYRERKRADHLAATSEGLHVDAGLAAKWARLSRSPSNLWITTHAPIQGFAAWEFWPAALAAPPRNPPVAPGNNLRAQSKESSRMASGSTDYSRHLSPTEQRVR